MPSLLQGLRSRVSAVGSRLSRSFRPNRVPTPAPHPYREMGVSGTAVYGGYVQVKERSPDWIGRQKWITASELAINTSIVAAGVHYFLNLVAYPKWTFQPHDEHDEESLALAEFAEHVVNDMDTPWYKVVRRAAMYRFHGFGLQEWTAKHREDGLIGFKDIEPRPQHTIEQWDVDFDGTVLGVWQRSPQTGAMLGIPRDKLLYLLEDTLTDSPEGIGMFRHMADPYKRLKQLQELEIRAYERDLRGTPIARAPLTFINKAVKANVITQSDADALIARFESLVKLQVKQSDTGVILDSLPYFSDSDAGDQVSAVPQWGFELLSGAGVGHGEIAAAIDRVQRELARIIGVEHLMMGDMGGNRALSEDKSRNLYLIANSVLKYVGSQVKGDILVPLWKLNGFPMDKLPEPKPEDVTFKNADAIANAIGKMASAGAVLSPNDPVINDVRDLLGVSRVPDDLAAQGALQQPNALLAALPPELQALAMGGPAAGPGGPPGAGPGGPKKPNMGGGKPFPGKRFGSDDEDGEERKPTSLDSRVGDKQPVDEAGNTPEEGKPDFDDSNAEAKPKSKAKSNDQLIQLLAQLLSQIASNASESDEDKGPQDLDTSDMPPGRERLAVESAAIRAETQGKDKPGGKGPNSNEGKDKPAVGKPAESGTGDDTGPKSKHKPDDRASDAEGDPTVGTPKPASTDEASLGLPQEAGRKKPVAGKPAVEPEASAKPGLSALASTAAGKPQPTTAMRSAQGQAKPQAGKPGAAAKPGGDPAALDDPNQAAQASAAGLPPGAPGVPQAEPEMTPERAVEILQPYAEHGAEPEEHDPKTESDLLWERLGQEKDVQAAVSDQDPMSVLDDVETVMGGKPKPGEDEEVEGPAQPEDGDVTDASADQPRRRERLAGLEDEEGAVKPKPRNKPGRRRVRL